MSVKMTFLKKIFSILSSEMESDLQLYSVCKKALSGATPVQNFPMIYTYSN